ncbi:MAG: DUF3710 domain-containing protein [Corynebacterium sp.]|nr:DUF3710 domain-containing protein [Corynebacterium sp.]
MWFRKKKSKEQVEEVKPSATTEEVQTSPAEPAASSTVPGDGPSGPYDSADVDLDTYDFSDYGEGALDLGSLFIPMPFGSDVQIEVGPQGPRLIHIRTPFGRITPVAFSAPRKTGQWRESLVNLRAQLREEGFEVTQVDGEFGPEVLGKMGENTLRILGIDGPRWMLRFTTLAVGGKEEEMLAAAYEMARRTVVRRDDSPLAPGQGLPVILPDALAEQVKAQMESAPNAKAIRQETPTTHQGRPIPTAEPAPESEGEAAPEPPRIPPSVGNAHGHVPPVHRMNGTRTDGTNSSSPGLE